MKLRRLDEVLLAKGMVARRRDAFVIVTEGRVLVNGQKAVSPAQRVEEDAVIEVRSGREFVGRGAYKLEAAIEKFDVDVQGQICVDVGSAAGGFVEVLLKHGAKKVYAIDIGRGKLDLKLREDPRVVVMEGVNVLALGGAPLSRHVRAVQRRRFTQRSARRSGFAGDHAAAETGAPASREALASGPRDGLETGLPPSALREGVDVVTVDVSFTSLRSVLPVVRGWLSRQGRVIALFKPQYEIKDKSLLKHGILRDTAARSELVEEFRTWLGENDWQGLGFMESPIRGSEGNVEYLFYLQQFQNTF